MSVCVLTDNTQVAAVVVEAFESILREHVALSYFVPLLIGHGGNTGSQSNATVIK